MRWRLCILAACLLFLLVGCNRSSKSPILEMICLDVGQGSSTLVRTAEGDILVDAGSEDSQDELCRKLRALGVERLSLLILTHPDEDHIGGADGVLEHFETDVIWTNGAIAENDSYDRLVRMVQGMNLSVRTVRGGDGITLGALQLSVLSPISEHSEDGNEDSLVLLLRCASFGALLMGDANERAEQTLVETYGAAHLDVDVLCVGHHGSNTSSSVRLLRVTTPQYAVISCGAGNSYGHPDGRTLARLKDAGAEICRTDLEGDVTIAVFEDGFARMD